MTHLWATPERIRVVMSATGHPVAFTWGSQCHPVRLVANHWREDQGWWDRRVWRDYFRVVTATGLLAEIFQDQLTGEWYLQRIYD